MDAPSDIAMRAARLSLGVASWQELLSHGASTSPPGITVHCVSSGRTKYNWSMVVNEIQNASPVYLSESDLKEDSFKFIVFCHYEEDTVVDFPALKGLLSKCVKASASRMIIFLLMRPSNPTGSPPTRIHIPTNGFSISHVSEMYSNQSTNKTFARDNKAEIEQLSNAIQLANRFTTLDEALSVYTNTYFLSPDSEAMCRKALDKGLHNDVFLVPANGSNKEILSSLRYRYPNYMGKPLEGLYHEEKLKEIHGYTTKDVTDRMDNGYNGRFAICGPVLIKWSGILCYVAHVWGVNFESDRTEDFKSFDSKEKDEAVQMYKQRCDEMYKSILTCAKHVGESFTTNIHMPCIGQGAFLSSIEKLGKFTKKDCIDWHSESLSRTFADATKDDINVILYDFVGNFPETEGITVKRGGNLFEPVISPFSTSVELMVNAWDNKSFIGNGGSDDETIDGWMISGEGPGESFINSSYTHNPFFATQLYDPKTWHRVNAP